MHYGKAYVPACNFRKKPPVNISVMKMKARCQSLADEDSIKQGETTHTLESVEQMTVSIKQ